MTQSKVVESPVLALREALWCVLEQDRHLDLFSTGPTKETSQHDIEIVDWDVKNQLKQKVFGAKRLIMSRIHFCHLKRSSICGERKPL